MVPVLPRTASRLPRTVVKRHRKKATVIWVSLIIAFIACKYSSMRVLGRIVASKMLTVAFQDIAHRAENRSLKLLGLGGTAVL